MSSKWKFIFFNVFRLKQRCVCVRVYVLVAGSNCRLEWTGGERQWENLSNALRVRFRARSLSHFCCEHFFKSSFKHISVALPIANNERYGSRGDDVVVWDNRRDAWVKRSIFLSPVTSMAFCYSDSVLFPRSLSFWKVRNNASVCQLKLKHTSLSLSLSLSSSSSFIQDSRR